MFCEPKTNRKKGTAYNMVLAKDGAELLIELSVIFSRKILFVSHFLFNLVPRKSILLIFVIIETLVLLIPSFSQYLFRCTQSPYHKKQLSFWANDTENRLLIIYKFIQLLIKTGLNSGAFEPHRNQGKLV